MIRQFNLEEISFYDFEYHCEKWGVPCKRGSSVLGGGNQRFFEILDNIVYRSVAELLGSLEDGLQKLNLVWVPGMNSVGEAKRKTINRGEYFSDLVKREEDYDKLVVEFLTPSSGNWHRNYKDVFDFYKSQSVWVFGFMKIKEKNIEKYELACNGELLQVRDFLELNGLSAVLPSDISSRGVWLK